MNHESVYKRYFFNESISKNIFLNKSIFRNCYQSFNSHMSNLNLILNIFKFLYFILLNRLFLLIPDLRSLTIFDRTSKHNSLKRIFETKKTKKKCCISFINFNIYNKISSIKKQWTESETFLFGVIAFCHT